MSEIKSTKYTIRLKSSMNEIAKLEMAIEELKQLWDIEERALFQLNLILEELIYNTIVYGFQEISDGFIELNLEYNDSSIYIDMLDNALLFNSVELKEIPFDSDYLKQSLGDLGMILTVQIAKDLKYEYRDKKNHLSFRITN